MQDHVHDCVDDILNKLAKKETLISLSLLIDTIKKILGFKSLALKKTNKKKVNKQTHKLCACHFSIMNKWPMNSGFRHIQLDPLIQK